MKKIIIDASDWKTGQDFYNAMFSSLGSPNWHGTNVNALVESMVWGEINKVEPPFRVEIVATKHLPASIMQELTWTAEGVVSARADRKRRWGEDVKVSFQIMS